MPRLITFLCLFIYLSAGLASLSWSELEEEYNSSVSLSDQMDIDGDGDLETDDDGETEENPVKFSSFSMAQAPLTHFFGYVVQMDLIQTPEYFYGFNYSYLFITEILQPPKA